MGKILFIENARLSFNDLGEPTWFGGKPQRPGQPRQWSATGIIIPGETTVKLCDAAGKPAGASLPAKDAIDKAVQEVAQEKWPKDFAQKLKAILPDPKGCAFTDGDLKTYAGYAGNWILAAKRDETKGRPLVIDNDRSPIYKADNSLYEGKAGRLFSGCWVNMHVELWAQDNTSGKAIRCGLLGVQRLPRAADAFGGGAAPIADAFGDVADGAGADDDLG